MGILLVTGIIGAHCVPAFVLGSLKAGAPPWTRRFWTS
jgi:hypothetical protein